MKILIKTLLNKVGYSIHKTSSNITLTTTKDIKEKEFWDIYNLCKPYTMTSLARMYSLYLSVEYILSNNIDGCFVECGVWRGGSSMLIAKMLQNRNSKRKIYLYDTFEGMSKPTDKDFTRDGESASKALIANENNKDNSVWCFANLHDVKKNLSLTNYEESNIIYVKGKVENTIPNRSPKEKIALLRLDTDWYESTMHELTYLFPKLIQMGF